jgi:hypothetical protein
MKKLILATILISFAAMPVHAQIFKKIKQKVEDRLEKKEADKTADEAGESSDTFNSSGLAAGFNQVDAADIPESYDFDWNYVMSVSTAQGDMELEYFLKKDASYFGMKVPQNDMFMVIDQSRKLNVMFMESGGNKMFMTTKIPDQSSAQSAGQDNYNEEFNFKKIGEKKILGYNCTGFQGENEDTVFTFYVTSEPGISFNDLFKSENTKLPKGFDPDWIKDGQGLMMQMIMEGKKNAKENVTMTCTKLEKKPFSIKKSDYRSIAGK